MTALPTAEKALRISIFRLCFSSFSPVLQPLEAVIKSIPLGFNNVLEILHIYLISSTEDSSLSVRQLPT
jgi:hypothetical protein